MTRLKRVQALACRIGALALISCSDGDIRGHAVSSPNGKTYLVVDDDNGGKCGPITVDGHVWRARLHAPAWISPGLHQIACGSSAAFEVKAGTTYHFSYWGP